MCEYETVAKIAMLRDGIKVSKAPGGNPDPAKRGRATGWSESAARRNRDFLMAVDGDQLRDPASGDPFALSLTFGRQKTVSPADLKASREAFFDRLRRRGLIRLHWLVEFQRDGTPHLHMLAYMPANTLPESVAACLRDMWLEVTAPWGSTACGQYVVPVGHLTGWKQYLAKHGVRGVRHYQRQMPDGWEVPGRMWGKLGEWPTWSAEVECDLDTFFRFRRLLRSYRIAAARSELATANAADRAAKRAAIRHARRCLRHPFRDGNRRTSMRGAALWLPREVSGRMLMHLASMPGAFVRDWAERDTLPRSDQRGL